MEHKKKFGFTVIEILLVVAAISILAGIVVLAVNPNKQLANKRNSQRRADVNVILNAVYQYSIDSSALPANITTTPTAICKTGGDCAGLVDLSVLTANSKYIATLPFDPTDAINNSTGYVISKDANNHVTISANDEENGEKISLTR